MLARPSSSFWHRMPRAYWAAWCLGSGCHGQGMLARRSPQGPGSVGLPHAAGFPEGSQMGAAGPGSLLQRDTVQLGELSRVQLRERGAGCRWVYVQLGRSTSAPDIPSLSWTGSPFSCSKLLPPADEDLRRCLEPSPAPALPLSEHAAAADQKPAACL